METKKAVVTAIAENTKQWAGPNGTVFYHTITFANGDTGQYGSKSEKCEKFKINQEADYTKEVKVNGAYTNVVIKPLQENNGGGQGKKFEPKDQGIITWLSCFSSVCELTAEKQGSNSVKLEEVLDWSDKAFERAMKHSTLNKQS